jgi:hypothetical protein
MNLEEAQRAWLKLFECTVGPIFDEDQNEVQIDKLDADQTYAIFRTVHVRLENMDQLEDHIKSLTGGSLY